MQIHFYKEINTFKIYVEPCFTHSTELLVFRIDSRFGFSLASFVATKCEGVANKCIPTRHNAGPAIPASLPVVIKGVPILGKMPYH